MKAKTKKIYLLLLICLLLVVGTTACKGGVNKTNARSYLKSMRTYTYEIVNSWPHDTTAFTQGLAFWNGSLYESTGLNGSSSMRIVDLNTGNVQNKVDVSAEYFAEGMTILDGKIFQLTWQNEKGFIYDENSLELLGEFSYTGQGWGLADDDHFLIMSNGTNTITFLDPQNFQVQKTIEVYDNGNPLVNLNELEYVKGKIYANIWHDNRIVLIDPESGGIRGWIDLTELAPEETQQNSEAVLNGIAYDQTNDRLFVTGKLWPTIFEIKLK
jgi:glutaminyl-peptide cyclotransferase